METTRPSKAVYTWWARDCPPTTSPRQGWAIAGSVKIEMTVYADKCKVTLTGTIGGGQSRSHTFAISGYDYPPVPQHIMDFITENGVTSDVSSR